MICVELIPPTVFDVTTCFSCIVRVSQLRNLKITCLSLQGQCSYEIIGLMVGLAL